MFSCEKLKNENCAHCNQGIVQDEHVREKKISFSFFILV